MLPAEFSIIDARQYANSSNIIILRWDFSKIMSQSYKSYFIKLYTVQNEPEF